MAIGRPMPPLILDDTERETLERWVRRPKTAQALALRARMILGCAEGRNTAVGTDLGVSDETVGKWRSRFLERRLDGLSVKGVAKAYHWGVVVHSSKGRLVVTRMDPRS